MLRWQKVVGVALGLLIGLTLLALTDSARSSRDAAGPILSESDGHFRDLVIQYDPAAAGIVTNAYRDFLTALEADVSVHVVCPTRAAFDDLVSNIGKTHCALSPIIAGHPITTWARDRWVALSPGRRDGPTTLWSPLAEAGQELWPARAGDQKVGFDIAAALGPAVRAHRSRLNFDGGDFLADAGNVFIMPRVLDRNIQHTVTNQPELLGVMQLELKRKVILLREAPDHHAGMFMTSIGNRTMLVADPRLGEKILIANQSVEFSNVVAGLPGGPDFRPETKHAFDAVATQCAAHGYAVVRIPVIPARDGRTFLTYVNVLIDEAGGGRIVYLPQYRGCDPLNFTARRIWREQGYEVRLVDCTDTYRHFGCLHCLVNVLSRADSKGVAREMAARTP